MSAHIPEETSVEFYKRMIRMGWTPPSKLPPDIAGLLERLRNGAEPVSRALNYEAASALEHLAGENARLRADRDAWKFWAENGHPPRAAPEDTPAGLDRQGPRDSAG